MRATDQFYALTPDVIMEAVEKGGWQPTGEYLQLNSYENRVFSIRLEKDPFEIIGKFYRPGRWSHAALLEEHQFLAELKDVGVPAIAPFPASLRETRGILTVFFPKARGRIPPDFNEEDMEKIGLLLARVHNIGAQRPCHHRHRFDAGMGWSALETLKPIIEPTLKARYLEAAKAILHFLEDHLDPKKFQRIHGDCHRGNLLQTDVPGQPKEFFLLDFDDFGMGPAVQDFWMLCLGDEEEAESHLSALLRGYRELRDFDDADLRLLEPLRGLRIIHYAAWIARRWSDPSFPRIFPQFGTESYWLDELQSLEPIADSLQ
jgi:Ser/Thr protein kinase RdoA (MazF antagonist)